MNKYVVFLCFMVFCLTCLSVLDASAAYSEYRQVTYDLIQDPELKEMYKRVNQQGKVRLGATRKQVEEELGRSVYSRVIGVYEFVFYKKGYRLLFVDGELGFICYLNKYDDAEVKRFGSLAFNELINVLGKPDHIDHNSGIPTYTSEEQTIRFLGGKTGFEGYMIGSMDIERVERFYEIMDHAFQNFTNEHGSRGLFE